VTDVTLCHSAGAFPGGGVTCYPRQVRGFLGLVLLVTGACGQVIDNPDGTPADSSAADSRLDVEDAASPDAMMPDDATTEGDASEACTFLLSSDPCNTLPEGNLLTVGCTSSPPTPMGGAIIDGTYDLVQVDWDTTAPDAGTCPMGFTRRGTIEVCGNTLLWLDYNEVGGVWRGDTHISVSGSAISFSEFCSGNDSWSFGYTATGAQLVILWQYPQGERLVMTFNKQ
jgi:hypothetical protein